MRSYKKSEILTKEFNELFPGGHSNFRMKMNATTTKLFVNKAQNSHIWDVDGNEYIAYHGAMGPTLLGFHNQEYIDSLKDYLDREGPTYGSNLLFHEEDIELAKLLIKYIPCAEEVKFSMTGSEAVQLSFRIARAYTGKPRILRFGGHYHGWFDNVVDMANREKDDPLYPEAAILEPYHPLYTEGKSPWAKDEVIVVPYNDFDALEDVFKNHHQEIAMADLEALCTDNSCIHPRPGYLERLRELCSEYNVVLCFDEIVNGFRLAPGGAQEYFGVTPDICTIGKAVSGGIPFSAVVGQKKVMDVFRQKHVLGAGTYNGYGLGVHACLTAIRLYERNDWEILKHNARLQNKLLRGIVEINDKYNVDCLIPEAPHCFYIYFGAKGGRKVIYENESFMPYVDNKFFDAFRIHMLDEGIAFGNGGKCMIDGGHTDDDIDFTLRAYENSLVKTLEDKKNGYKYINKDGTLDIIAT